MIWSKYNHLFLKEGHYFLYNSLSNCLLELDNESYLEMKRISETMVTDDEDLMRMLVDMKIILESDELEIKRIVYRTKYRRFSKNKLILTICPTLSCNFRCPYCFERTHPVGNMSSGVEQKIVEFVKNHGAKSLSVTWFGGEPLLNFESIRTLTNEFLHMPVEYNAGIITNGYLLTSEIASQLEALKITRVQITIDGPKKLHDSRRSLKNGGATFDIITHNLKHAASVCKNVTFSVRVNLDSTNCEFFEQLHQHISDFGLSNIHVSPSFVTDYSTEQNNMNIMPVARQKEFLIGLSALSGVRYDRFYPSNDRYECAVRNMNAFVIGPNGELYKCWNDVGNEKRIYGTIDNRIINEEVMFEYLLEEDPLENRECLECFLFPRCGGGCPYNRLWSRHYHTKQTYCPLHKNYLEDLLWTHYKLKNRL